MLYPELRNVRLYTYRTAQPAKRIFVIPRAFVENLENELNKITQSHPDNHTTFSFSMENSGFYSFSIYSLGNNLGHYMDTKNLSVLFHDGVAIFGEGIEEKDW